MSITQAVQGTINAITIGKEIYSYVAKMMDEAEKSKQSGAAKLDIVLKLARDFVIDLGKNWDSWHQHILNFINAAKSIFNAVKGILK